LLKKNKGSLQAKKKGKRKVKEAKSLLFKESKKKES